MAKLVSDGVARSEVRRTVGERWFDLRHKDFLTEAEMPAPPAPGLTPLACPECRSEFVKDGLCEACGIPTRRSDA